MRNFFIGIIELVVACILPVWRDISHFVLEIVRIISMATE